MIDFRAKFGSVIYEFVFVDLDILIVRGLGTYRVNPEEFNRCFSLGRKLSLKRFLSKSIFLVEENHQIIERDSYFVEIESRFLSMKVLNKDLITRDDIRKFGIKKVLESPESYDTRSVRLFDSWIRTLTKRRVYLIY